MEDMKAIYRDIKQQAEALKDEIILLRRQLHQHPEVGNEEFETTALLKRQLSELGLTIHDSHAPTGLWAELDTGKPGPVIAVRTDIDALPVTEQTSLPYASRVAGKMHACGHDVHMAVVIGSACLLSNLKERLRGTVKFICQPAEEVPPGGARPLIAAGVLENPKVDAIVGLHVDPSVPAGSIGLRDGVTMASVFDFDLVVIGKGGHAALPHETVDAIVVTAQIIAGLQNVVSRMIDPVTPVVITFGGIEGGTARNIVAETVIVRGTARSLDPKLTRKLPGMIKRTAQGIGKSFGARVEVNTVADYPLFAATPAINRSLEAAYRGVFPGGKIIEIPQVMGGEDFACYLEKVPGAMFRLGVRNGKVGADKPWHHPQFIIDEEAIPVGMATMAAAVATLLHEKRGRQ
jgi:amidohydrolase